MQKFIICLLQLTSFPVYATPIFDCSNLLERIVAPFTRKTSLPVYSSSQTSERAKELKRLGFKRFQNTDFYQNGFFTVELVDGEMPRFWRNYSTLTPSSIWSIARTTFVSHFALTMLGKWQGQDSIETRALKGSGSSGGEYVPVHNPADKTVREQLTRAGFEPASDNPWILTLKTEEGAAVVALLTTKGGLQSLLKPLEGEALHFIDENTSFLGFRVKPPRFSSSLPESILTLDTSYLRFEMSDDGGIKYGSQVPKQDLGSLTDEELGYRPIVATRVDAGFIIAGRNETDTILQLKTLNGISISKLENIMRPKASSQEGFLGKEETLLTVLEQDNRFVVNEMALTHQMIARHLKRFRAIYYRGYARGVEFSYQGRRFVIENFSTKGWQNSPFSDNTRSGADFKITNLDSQKSIEGGWLVAEMIERYGFYEGQGTTYRLDPREILEVFDFIR